MSLEQSSVSEWLAQLQEGDGQAARKLWEEYFRRLVGLARVKLGNLPKRMADEEDVALSAFKSFCRGAAEGRFPDLDDRNELWKLLVAITAHKAFQLRLYHGRQKRGGGAVLDEAAIAGRGGGIMSLAQFLASEPTPEFAVQAAEEYQRLLTALDDENLRQVAQWKMDNYTNEEIANQMGCSSRKVERKLRLIRACWATAAAGA